VSAHGTAQDARPGVHALATFRRSIMDHDSNTRASAITGFTRALPFHFEHRPRKRTWFPWQRRPHPADTPQPRLYSRFRNWLAKLPKLEAVQES
jgi:hypothetical protein